MQHFLLCYEIGPDYLERRGEFRAEHLRLAREYADHGQLVMGGAVGNPLDLAMILFLSDTPEVAEEFARKDPYVTSGLVKAWGVREWTTVAGPMAAQPVKVD